MDKKKIAIIFNASSGTQGIEPPIQQIKDICHEYALKATFFLVHPGTDIHQIIKKALHEQYTFIVAAGGDGTVSAVASELAGTPNILGIIPLGTLNHFAKDIQIPLDLRKAFFVLSHGKVVALDTASVNDQFFINNSSIGLYPKIVKHRENFQQKGFRKWIAFLSAFLLVVNKNSFLHLHIVSSQKDIICKVPILFIGNNRYIMKGYELGSRKSLNHGKLFISLMYRTTRLKIFRIAVQSILGLPSQDAHFNTWESREVTVHTKLKFLQVALDGETMPLQTPLRYLIHPHSLRVIVPQKYAHNHPHF